MPAEVVYELQAPVISIQACDISVNAVSDETTRQDEDEDVDVDQCVTNVDACPSDVGVGVCDCDAAQLGTEQQDDATLSPCWDQAKAGKGGFVIHNGLLYHRDQVEGQSESQLCVPKGRRHNVLRLAYESVFGCHLGERITRERIRLSFYWLGLRKSVLSHVQSCCSCQLQSSPVTMDYVPITPVTRADVLFQVMNMDCIDTKKGN